MCHQCHTQHTGRFGAHLVDGFDHFHTAALAAPSGVNLRFHDPNRAAQFLCRFDRLIGAKGNKPARHRNAKRPEDLFGLIFMNIHG